MRVGAAALLVALCMGEYLWASEKSGAIFGIEAGSTPRLEASTLGASSHAPLASLGVKYGARHYFNQLLGISLYLPLEGGYSSLRGGDFAFASIGMGGDLLLDFGVYRGLGLFVGGEMAWARYWLGSGGVDGAQSRVHAGLALNLSPRLRVQGGVKYLPFSPLCEGRSTDRANGGNYGVFVGIAIGLDNSQITQEQRAREERYRREKEEEDRRIASYRSKYGYYYDYGSQGSSAESGFSAFLRAIFSSSQSSQNTQGTKK